MSLPPTRVRELIRLLGEMREIERGGGDPTAHAAEGAVRMVGADAGGLVLMPSTSANSSNVIETSLAGYTPSMAAEVNAFYGHDQGSATDIAATALVGIDARGDGVCRTRRRLVPDRVWYRSPFVDAHRRRWGLDDSIYGSTRAAVGNYTGIGLFRAFGERPFSDEEAQLVELFAEGCKGTVFPRADTPSVTLTGRQRETLQCLLAGDSAKQIAAKLEISIHTVGDHVKAVYRAHGVRSRAELLALLLTRP